jgi:hypothetical protein
MIKTSAEPIPDISGVVSVCFLIKNVFRGDTDDAGMTQMTQDDAV